MFIRSCGPPSFGGSIGSWSGHMMLTRALDRDPAESYRFCAVLTWPAGSGAEAFLGSQMLAVVVMSTTAAPCSKIAFIFM